MNKATPYLLNNRWYIDKDPDDKRFVYADVTSDLADMNTTAQLVTALVTGVTLTADVDGPAVVQGTIMRAKVQGLDVSSASADNFITFRITCANGEQFDRTIYFNRVDN